MVADPDSPFKQVAADSQTFASDPSPKRMQPVDGHVDDDLPEIEELTPELLEDECIRGDVMLRAAVIMLAFLLGCVLVTNSDFLVQLKRGEYLLSHGWFPPSAHVLAANSFGNRAELGWLSDVVAAGMHRMLGMSGLSILTALTVTASFWIAAKIRLIQITSWWQSILLVMALIAAYPVFQPGRGTFTFLSVAALLLWMSGKMTGVSHSRSWGIVVLMFLVGNADGYAFLSLLALLAFLIVERVRPESSLRMNAADRKMGWIALAVGLLVNPHPFRTLTSLTTTFATQVELNRYGVNHEWFPQLDHGLFSWGYWQSFNLFSLAAVSLLIISGITLILNRRQVLASWVAVWLTVNLFGSLTGEGVTYAAFLNAIFAAIHGQQWFQQRFINSYEITRWNVVSSRAGRAITVLGMFLVAYLSLNGALMGPETRRIGLGLDPRVQNRITSLEQDLFPHEEDLKIIPTTPQQGDLLIWIGQVPYLDSRPVSLFGGALSSEVPISVHRDSRRQIFEPSQEPNSSSSTLQYLVGKGYRDVFVRLWSPRPAYGPLHQIMQNPDFVLTELGSAGARFRYLKDLPEPERQQFLAEHKLDFNKLAFQRESDSEKQPANDSADEKSSDAASESVAIWPLPASSYDQWVVQKINVMPPAAEYSRHVVNLVIGNQAPLSLAEALSIAQLSVQLSRQAIQDEPNHPAGYRQLSEGLDLLTRIENQVVSENGLRVTADFSRNQILTSAFSAALAGNEDPVDLLRLIQVQAENGAADSALATIKRFDRAVADDPTLQQSEHLDNTRKALAATVEATHKLVETAREQKREAAELAAIALGGNCPELALSLMEEDKTKIFTQPDYQLFYTTLLLQNGQIEQAYTQIHELKTKFDSAKPGQIPPAMQNQYEAVAMNVYLCAQDFESFLKLIDDASEVPWATSLQGRLALPFASYQLPLQQVLWPMFNTQISLSTAVELPNYWTINEFSAVKAELEVRNFESARNRIREILKWNPEFAQQTLIAFYAQKLGVEIPDEQSAFTLPPEWITNFQSTSAPLETLNLPAEEKPAETVPETAPETVPETLSESAPATSPAPEPEVSPEASPAPMQDSVSETAAD